MVSIFPPSLFQSNCFFEWRFSTIDNPFGRVYHDRMMPQWIIEKKRDGRPLGPSEIHDFLFNYTTGNIPDYQMAALAMAIYFQGMSPAETAALTRAMIESGDTLNAPPHGPPRIDKHSTGGVGDKVSLLLAPLAACCGIAVPMIAGRGLGITGGTLDKLESIPGYRTNLTATEFSSVLADCGCSIMGQTPRLCPADRKLYALRDVTGTVPSIPLITASIMSKKLAESLNGLVLDVKCGPGAFMPTRERAETLARSLMEVGRAMNLPVSAWITRMDEPLGRSAGNRPEVAEVIRALRGEGPDDLMTVTFALAARMLRLAGLVRRDADAMPRLHAAIRDGSAEARFRDMVRLQGGNVDFLNEPDAIESTAAGTLEINAPAAGWVARVDAEGIGKACVLLGAGRSRTEDPVDPAAGLSKLVKVGEPVEKGRRLATLHASDAVRLESARPLVEAAIAISPQPVETRPVLIADLGNSPT